MKRIGSILMTLVLLLSSLLIALPAPALAVDAGDSGQPVIQLVTNGTAANITGAQKSNVYFGNYPQNSDGNGGFTTAPIKWRVLANKEGKLFLLSDQLLDAKHYHNQRVSITWEKCDLRSWLNGTSGDAFFANAFSSGEQAAIATTTVINDNNPEYDISGGNNTNDKLFLLSIAEVTNTAYGFSDSVSYHESRKVSSTAYAIEHGVIASTNYWWLRSPGKNEHCAADIRPNSANYQVFNQGDPVLMPYGMVGVRPAFNLNLFSVLYTAAVSGETNAWKLGLYDSKMTVTEGSGGVTRSGSTVTVPYAIAGSDAGNANKVALLITNKNDTWSADGGWSSGAAKLYYETQALTATSGTVSFTLPDSLKDKTFGTDYKAWLLAVDENGNHESDYLSAPVELHIHDWSYTASGASVTAKCTSGCPDGYDTNGITLTLNAPTSLTYNGSAKAASISGYPTTAPGGLAAKPTAIAYFQSTGSGSTTPSGSALSGAPSESGNYVAQMTWGEKTASLAFAIQKEIKVTFKVENGYWNEGNQNNADIEVTLKGPSASLNLTADKIPAAGNKPAEHYKTGGWDVTPSTSTAITQDTTYTYTYAEQNKITYTVTFKVANGKWDDETTADKTVPLSRYENEDLALKLAQGDIPAVGNKPDAGYKAGDWDVTPSTDTAISGNTTYTYTYAKAPAAISYSVTSGDGQEWRRGSNGDLTFTVKRSAGDEKTFGNFQSAALDGQALGSGDFGTAKGSLVFTLKASKAKTLALGKHTLDFEFTDGTASASFTVKPVKGSFEDVAVPSNTFTFKKVWQGGSEKSIDFTLYKLGDTVYRHGFDKKAVSKSEWKYSAWFSEAVACYVIEAPVEGYTTQYVNVGVYANITDRCCDGGTIVNVKIPKTGDDAHLILWLVCALAGMTAVSVAVAAGKRKKGIKE